MAQKQKLELTWIGKENRPRLEPRILLEDQEKSYHALARVTDSDIFDNLLIYGDNLLALKALEQEFTGKVKCIFIDPPYNTGSAFTHYDDGLEHSIWLSMMRARLVILKSLLSEEGTLWITIDDNEVHYLKVLCDEVFGRSQFVANLIWQKATSARNDALFFSGDHDHILVYSKNILRLKLNGLPRTAAAETAYSNPDNDPRGPWREGDYKCAKNADERPNLYYPIKHPKTGLDIWPRRTAVWRYSQETHLANVEEGRIWWGKTGNYSLPKLKRFRSEAPSALVPRTLWLADEVGQTRTAKGESKDLVPDDPFSTPKPEKLLRQVLDIATDKGDLVLDSFAGSGTTGAVAHKMGRRWIMVELGEHCHTHIIPRLRKVISGEDKGGITAEKNWKGGGGFRYFRLAPSLLEKDRFGNAVISRHYNSAMLAEAMCKLMGFRYSPSNSIYWQHGKSTEADFIYVTTQILSTDQLHLISDEVGTERSLLICGIAFRSRAQQFSNLELKKIPTAVLQRCEWGKDDYSLKVENLPAAPAPQQPRGTQPSLFEADSQ
jgi:adenine-specific DNA-methyltransferase